MPLKTSEAYVIDVRKLREADRLVVLFTEADGKVRGVAASAAKSRRRFGGKLERLSRIRVTYFEKEGRDLARIDSCDLLDESFTLYQDLRSAVMLAYVAELVDTFTHEREPDPTYFRLLKSMMAAVRAGGDPRLLARYFEIWTLRLHGLLPEVERCEECGAHLRREGAHMATGAMAAALCARCARRHRDAIAAAGSGSAMLSPAALGVLETFRRKGPAEIAPTETTAGALEEIESFAMAILIGFVGHTFRSYRFMKEMAV